MQAIVDRSLASVSESIVKAVDARLEEFKTRVAAEICRAICSRREGPREIRVCYRCARSEQD